MQGVRAAFAYDVDLIGAEAVLRRIRRCLLFELLDRVLRDDNRRSIQRYVGIDDTVQSVVEAGGPGAVDAVRTSLVLAHGGLFPIMRINRAGAEQEKRGEVSAVQRQLFNLALANQLRDGGSFGIERDRGRLNLDGLGHLS